MASREEPYIGLPGLGLRWTEGFEEINAFFDDPTTADSEPTESAPLPPVTVPAIPVLTPPIAILMPAAPPAPEAPKPNINSTTTTSTTPSTMPSEPAKKKLKASEIPPITPAQVTTLLDQTKFDFEKMVRPEIERLARQVDVYWSGATKKVHIQRLLAWQVSERVARLTAAGRSVSHITIPETPGPPIRPYTNPNPTTPAIPAAMGAGSASLAASASNPSTASLPLAIPSALAAGTARLTDLTATDAASGTGDLSQTSSLTRPQNGMKHLLGNVFDKVVLPQMEGEERAQYLADLKHQGGAKAGNVQKFFEHLEKQKERAGAAEGHEKDAAMKGRAVGEKEKVKGEEKAVAEQRQDAKAHDAV